MEGVSGSVDDDVESVSFTKNNSDNNDFEKVEVEAESFLFKEKDQVLKLIDSLKLQSEQQENQDITREGKLDSIRAILDKYLECPTLLDPSLQLIMDKLVTLIKQQLNDASTQNQQGEVAKYSLTAVYCLSKVRGYKYVNRFLSHNVDDVDLIWQALLSWKMRKQHQDCDYQQKNPSWEPLYVLWHWMGVLSLIPFHSNVVSGDDSLVSKIMDAAKQDLEQHTGPVQQAAATCMASWLSRPDVDLVEFADWAVAQTMRHFDNNDDNSSSSNHRHNNLVLGVLQVVVKVLKHATASRQVLMDQLVKPLWDPLLRLADHPSNSNNLLLRRYLVKWWTRTSCTYFPPTRALAPWRYQRGQRMLLMGSPQNHNQTQPQQQEQQQALGTPQSLDSQRLQNTQPKAEGSASRMATDAEDGLFFVPDEVEDAMGRLLESLGHSSTIVRWSAAKGVGRLTERLPQLCALDVLDAVLEYFENPQKDHCWHGACLALAELARKGLLLPHSLHEVVHEIVKAMHYDVKRGYSSVGSNVRDAACYAFWAFARSYNPAVLREHLDKLSEAVILTSLFDREVNCRRAASAAVQEAVGRQGMVSFPNGIYVVTTADFFSLGNRTEAYTSIAPKIAKLEEYKRPIIDHLHKNKLFHWDPVIRQLSSQALAAVAHLDSDYIGQNAMPFLMEKSLDSKNLNVRHGAVLGVAELVRALGADCNVLETCMSNPTRSKMLDLVNQIEKRRLYRGRGGEIMRAAVCRLVECISLAKVSLDVKTQVGMLDAVDASIPHPNEEIQQCACAALERLLTTFFPVGEKGPTDRLRTRVLDKFLKMLRTSTNPAATRGYALALGFLPDKLVAPTSASLDSVVKTLAEAADPMAKVDGEGDAETRRNAVKSIARLVETITISSLCTDSKKYPVQPLSQDQCSLVIESLFLSMEDYNVDRRGDVGSWSRIAAMDGLTALALLCGKIPESSRITFASLSGTKLIGGLIKQLSEKLDGVRVRAASCLQKILLQKEATFPSIIGKAALVASLELESVTIDYNWAEPKSVFRRVMAAAMVNDEVGESIQETLYPYYDYAIAGIIISVGGKAEATQATLALLDHAKKARGTLIQSRLSRVLLNLFQQHKGDGRVTLPLLRSIEKLLSRECLSEVLFDESQFAMPLIHCLESELKGCRDIHRLFALVDIIGALLGSLPGECLTTRRRCFGLLCQMLGHNFPRVRSRAAEIMYIAISENPNGMMDKVTTLVLDTPWGSDLTREEVEQFTNETRSAIELLN